VQRSSHAVGARHPISFERTAAWWLPAVRYFGPGVGRQFHGARKQQLTNPPYQRAWIPPAYQRQIVQYHRKEAPGSILVDTSARHVYYVLPEGKAIRYGAIVGEYGQAWSGVATVGRKEEWPGWTPTEGEKRRLGPLPNYVEGGVRNPMGARALYLYAGGKDTLYRIHGTQPARMDRTCDFIGLHPADQ
jgi:lipoprotein-anchoring transpeptidase ErfK/SrfK